MSIPEETIDAIRARTDIVAVVSQYITLKKRGRNFVGLCPFHGEKTASFNVLPEQQSWHCFGCNLGGNVFTFLMRMDSLSFPEAVERLAARAGIEVRRDQASAEQRSLRQQIYDANKAAADFYAQQLRRSPVAREYLQRRGMTEESIEALSLGYAPPEWEALSGTLLRRGVPGAILAKAGLARERDSGGFYDYFRDRIIFPIRDVDGRVVAFGGRAMGDAEPKYLNSPESPVFDKSRTLYGLERARRAITEAGVSIVVEGYMDVAMVQQAGVQNVVATLGTALGQNHLEVLRRYAPRIVLAYDGDAAGAAAAERSLPLFENAEVEGRILILPNGRDPDEFIRESGEAAFGKAVAEALPLVEFQLRRIIGRADRSTPEGRAALAREVAPVLAGVRSAVKREEYVKRLAESWCGGQLHRVHEVEAALRSEVRRCGFRPGPAPRHQAVAGTAQAAEETPAVKAPVVPTGIARAEQFVLQGLLFRAAPNSEAYATITPSDFQIEAHRRLAEVLWQDLSHEAPVEMVLQAAGGEDEVITGLLTRLHLEQEKQPVNANMIEDCVWAIKERRLRERINLLQDALMRPDLSPEEYNRMGEEKRRLVKEMSDRKSERKAG